MTGHQESAPQQGLTAQPQTAPLPEGAMPATLSSPAGQTQDAPSTPTPRPRPPEVPGYEVQDFIGRGGMGVVYRARQLCLNRNVALKLIRDGALASPMELARSRREAEAVARLEHPHIVTVFEFGEAQGLPFFSM